ncbi:MAG: glucose-1-phosphate cytidylyltransferase [Candidatus Marinimicrobia bacterium]|nr:glucose-1-phosphate cytidylyltransferase [Candidatus Neomarinimicrobiota bacterium]
MKVIILAGGFGTRLSEYTESIPKPMVKIGGKPMLWHIMNTYSNFGHKDFYIALGYKAENIKDYFLKYRELNSDFTIDLDKGKLTTHQKHSVDWRVTLVDTGLNSMTGGRVKRMKDYIGKETFMLTYGDGLADININDLLSFHKKHGKMVTVTAVHPGARFGELDIDGEVVTSFKEKPQLAQGWINGGFFVVEPEFFDLITDDSTILEKDPLESVAEMGELRSFKHEGFWKCMDTKRDRDFLEEMWKSGKPLW